MSDLSSITERAAELAEEARELAAKSAMVEAQLQHGAGIDPFIFSLFVFVLACFVGYYVVWRVTPALHTPLMAVTNAISSIIIVGAILAIGIGASTMSQIGGFFAVLIASVNIFGGFIVTQRMLAMYKKKGS